MWIAKDKDGRINGFFFKPVKSHTNVLFGHDDRWTNRSFPPLWTDIPEDYLESMGIRVNE